jgi:Leucine-rich repeat (LRR) protein
MKRFLSAIINLQLKIAGLIFLCSSLTTLAQSDQQVYDDYVKTYRGSSDLYYYTSRSVQKEHGIPDSIQLEIKSLADIHQTISANLQGRVTYVRLSIADSANFAQCINALKDFPQLKYLIIGHQIPESIRSLNQLRAIEFNTPNIDMQDVIEKLAPMTNLRGLIFTNCATPLPASIHKLTQITFLKLNGANLEGLDLSTLKWKMLSLNGNYQDVFDETLADRLSTMTSLKELNLLQYTYTNSPTLTKLRQISTLGIVYMQHSPGVQLFDQLAGLGKLRHLLISSISDTTQRLAVLEKLTQFESLELRHLPVLKSHPEVLQAFSRYHNLRSLNLTGNDLTQFPDIFSNLQQLKALTIRNNDLQSGKLPPSIFKLSNLSTLDLSSNNLAELPEFPYKFRKLKSLNLSYNKLKQLPEAILKLNHLETLQASSNQISILPVSGWESLNQLKTLALDNNQITSFPAGVQNIGTLSVLNLKNNLISTMPEPENTNYRLQKLYLSNNQLKNLPEQIGKYTLLQELEAGHNKLTHIPSATAQLENLKVLNLENNEVSALPQKGFKNLHALELANNTSLNQDSVFNLVLSSTRKDMHLDLGNTGISALPATSKWADMGFKQLNLSGNKLTTLPLELTLIKSGRVHLENNPLKADTAMIQSGFRNPADMKILYDELGIPTPHIQISNADYVKSLTEYVSVLCRPGSFAKAVAYADKAIALDNAVYEKNIWWPTIALCRLETKDYAGAIKDCDTYLARGPFGYIDGGQNMINAEWCKTQAYLALGQKEKAAETYIYFAKKRNSSYSYLDAAFLYKELGKNTLYMKFLDSTLFARQKKHASTIKYGSPHPLYEYAEILIMANKPSEALEIIQQQEQSLFDEDKSVKSYLEATARFLQNPAAFERIKKELIDEVSRNGKIKDWYYRRFNTWLELSERPQKQKEQLYALQKVGK